MTMRFLTMEWAQSDDSLSDQNLLNNHEHLAGIDWHKYGDAKKLISGLDLRGAKISRIETGASLLLAVNPVGTNQTTIVIYYDGFQSSPVPSPVGRTIWYDEVRQEADSLCHSLLFTDRSELEIKFETLEIVGL